ncbi:MAG: cyclic nucleotide-binding domain-containing protein [Verrucomicrobia bacterium]|nr:cyclic nucleotide-binding domain-containing protein [Verrucomicrobiota bacterium]
MKNKKDTSAYQVWGTEKIIYGPIDLLTLVDWVRQKRITPECWIYCERRGTWSQAANLEELKLLFDPSQGRPGHLVGAIKAGVNPDVMLRIRVLSGLNDNQLHAFIRYMEILTLDSMTVAVREGDRGDAMFLILEGELRVRVMRHGKESILATLKAGDFFGEISLLDEGPRSADVVANDRSTLLKISTASFAKLRQEAPSLAEPFLHSLGQILVGRMRVLNKRYVDSVLMLQSLAVPRSMGSRNSNPRAGMRP